MKPFNAHHYYYLFGPPKGIIDERQMEIVFISICSERRKDISSSIKRYRFRQVNRTDYECLMAVRLLFIHEISIIFTTRLLLSIVINLSAFSLFIYRKKTKSFAKIQFMRVGKFFSNRTGTHCFKLRFSWQRKCA